MKICVNVKPQAKQEKLEKTGAHSYSVWVKAKPLEGKANQAVVKVLSQHFGVAKSKIVLIKGQKAKDKVFMVDL